MKKITLLILTITLLFPAFMSAQTASDSVALANADWNWVRLGKGAKAGYALVPMFGAKMSISIIKYPAKRCKTYIIDAQHPNEGTTPALAKKHKAKAAINASYFDMKRLIPSTYFAIDGKIVGNTKRNETFRTNGYIATKDKKGHQLEIAFTDTTKYGIYPTEYNALLTSGPVLLIDKKVPNFIKEKYFYDKRHPRTIIGYDDKGYVYYIVIDGRFPDREIYGASISEESYISKQLGLTHAINLDGGGSSTAWTKKTGVINHPYDNHKFDHEGCRTVPNIIIMK
ncbi:MAG: phosphodiester glycosidase family protein [Bacteroidaceae bacterium]|jgi:exopolysaccharide biosynthesis protein|nr:phosphodiester glycosidase family protein [Bacteroidaceae bacterium]